MYSGSYFIGLVRSPTWRSRFWRGFFVVFCILAMFWTACFVFTLVYFTSSTAAQSGLLVAFRVFTTICKITCKALFHRFEFLRFARAKIAHIFDYWAELFVSLALPSSVSADTFIIELFTNLIIIVRPFINLSVKAQAFIQRVCASLPCKLRVVASATATPLTPFFRAEIAARVYHEAMARFVSSLFVIPMVLFLTYGYNSAFFPFAAIGSTTLRDGLIFLGVQFVLNVLILALIRHFMMKWHGAHLDPLRWGPAFLAESKWAVGTLMLAGTTLPFLIMLRHFDVQYLFAPHLYGA